MDPLLLEEVRWWGACIISAVLVGYAIAVGGWQEIMATGGMAMVCLSLAMIENQ